MTGAALLCAAAAGHPACVQLLLRHACESLATAEGGRTALHLAALGGTHAHAQCCQYAHARAPITPD